MSIPPLEAPWNSRGFLPNLGTAEEQLFLAARRRNYQSNEFINGNESDNFAQLWRANALRRHQQLPPTSGEAKPYP